VSAEATDTRYVVVAPGEGQVVLTVVGADGTVLESRTLTGSGGTERSRTDHAPGAATDVDLTAAVRELERDGVRWTWADTALTYPPLLAAGVRVARCHDLRLARRILRNAAWLAGTPFARAAHDAWDDPAPVPGTTDGLFDSAALSPVRGPALDPVHELQRQLEVLRPAPSDPSTAPSSAPPQVPSQVPDDRRGRLRLLVAAESAGALVAAEMAFCGLPWRADVHDALLTTILGPRPVEGYRPAMLEAKLDEVRAALGTTDVNPDSPADLLRALRRAGLPVTSTRSWELKELDHPAVAPLLEYKKLARLWTANGWHWLDAWVRDGRFRPVYVVGGVVTGRWASDGGGALQLPHQVRDAVRADDGWSFVVADAAQLEPRILAAMSGDPAMARAGRAADMYEGIVATGAVETREHAKYGMLGAMYGGTQGVSGQVLPQLQRAFPRALGVVEQAAATGQRGGRVTTWLGRTSPPPGAQRSAAQGLASDPDADTAATDRARAQARSWGRFTRNFVVQGTAAEWALCWMALLRGRLRELGGEAALTGSPHLVFFLHDEVIVHTPAALADDVAEAVVACAVEAGRLLFGEPDAVEFRLSVARVTSYAQAKQPSQDGDAATRDQGVEG